VARTSRGGSLRNADGGELVIPRTVDLERVGGWVVDRSQGGLELAREELASARTGGSWSDHGRWILSGCADG